MLKYLEISAQLLTLGWAGIFLQLGNFFTVFYLRVRFLLRMLVYSVL